jgi:two-component system sensor histidine kinase VicK
VRAPIKGTNEISQLAQSVNQMAESLNENFQLLEAERDALRQFVQDASHELRTPVTALRNFNELLRSKAGEDPEARVEFLAESQGQIERLVWITDNLLNLSRLDASLIPLDLETISSDKLLQAAAAPFLAQATQAQINLSIQDSETLKLRGDRRLLEMALANLIENSLKFSPAGSEIELGADADGPQTLLWVQDNGPGIAEEDLPHVFERFYRSPDTDVPGSGLGLAMVRGIIRAHGGEAEIQSELGSGTRVILRLPAHLRALSS